MKIEFDTIEELQSLIAYLGSLKSEEPEKKTAKSRSEINKQNYERRKGKQSETQSEQSEIQTDSDKEEKREEVSPLVPPSLSPQTPLSYPPYNPPFPEERKGEKAQKHRYGNFSHVLLTDDEAQKLRDKFPDVEERIQRLDDYLENNRKKHYDNHYLTILNWARREEQQPVAKVSNIPERKKSWTEVAEELAQEWGMA